MFFFENRQQFNARARQKKTHVFFVNAWPKSNARAHLKQRKKHSGLIHKQNCCLTHTINIKTGYGNHERYVAIHEIARNIAPDLCNALTTVNDLMGCDSTSSFVGHGKMDSWGKVVSNIAKW